MVDYLIAENTLLEKLITFKVLPPEFDSKHSPIAATIEIETTKASKGKLFNPPKGFKWDSQCSKLFIDLINQKNSQLRLGTFSESLKNHNTIENLQKITKTFTQFMNVCASKSLKLKSRLKKNRKHSKPWYNDCCVTQKRNVQH